MGIGAWLVSPALALWMSPVVLGLALAIPLVALTSRRFGGLARIGVLRIPEEVQQPLVLARANALHREFAAVTGDKVATPARLRADPELLAAHRAMLPPPRRPGIDKLNVPLLIGRARLEEAAHPDHVWSVMTREEQAACLADAAALDLLIGRASTLHAETAPATNTVKL